MSPGRAGLDPTRAPHGAGPRAWGHRRPRSPDGSGSGALCVVLGNGAAAVHACRGLRESGWEGEVRVLSDHPEAPYNPMLTPHYLSGRIPREGCFPYGLGRSFYRRLGVRAELGDPVTALDAERRVVVTAAGRRHCYDACVVASGASPVRPPIPGMEGERVYVLRTMADADRLVDALAEGARSAVVLGASLTGLAAAEGLVLRGLDVTIVEREAKVLPFAAGARCAELLAGRLRGEGVGLMLGDAAGDVDEWTGGLRVTLASGRTLDADLVVAATGVRPDRWFVDPGQVACREGILVDEGMRTSVASLYAAGDVAEMAPAAPGGAASWGSTAPAVADAAGDGPCAGPARAAGLWSTACRQGRVAGRNIAGGGERYSEPLPHGLTHAFGSTYASVGDVRGPGTAWAIADPLTGAFGRLAAGPGGTAVGFEALDACELAGVARRVLGRAGPAPGRVGAGRSGASATVRTPARMAWAELRERMLAEAQATVGPMSTGGAVADADRVAGLEPPPKERLRP